MALWLPLVNALVKPKSAAAFTPATLSPLIWLDGEDEVTITSDRVSTWGNMGSLADFTQGTEAARPIVAAGAINSLDAIQFDGAQAMNGPTQAAMFTADVDEDCYMAAVIAADTYFNGDICVFIPRAAAAFVLQLRHTTGSAYSVNFRNQSAGTTNSSGLTGSPAAGTFAFIEIIKDGALIDAYVNGTSAVTQITTARVLMNSTADSDTGTVQSAIGARDSVQSPTDMKLAHLLIAKALPSAGNRTSYKSYIASRYGLTIA